MNDLIDTASRLLRGDSDAQQDLKEAHDDRTYEVCADVVEDVAMELRDMGNRDDADAVMDVADALRRQLPEVAYQKWHNLDSFVRDRIGNSIETSEEEDACYDLLGVKLL